MANFEIPLEGEWYIHDGKLHEILESSMTEYNEGEVGLTIWLKVDEEGDLIECGE